jgi:hypothetical protein
MEVTYDNLKNNILLDNGYHILRNYIPVDLCNKILLQVHFLPLICFNLLRLNKTKEKEKIYSKLKILERTRMIMVDIFILEY